MTKADKGNSTVIINHTEYIRKGEFEFNKKECHTKLNYNPLNQLTKSTSKFLKKWLNFGMFDCDDSFTEIELNISNTNLPRAYALIKIHKNGYPIRIIVSFVGSPLYEFDKCLT